MQNNLRDILDGIGETQTEFALKANIAGGTINKICRGKYKVSVRLKNRVVLTLNTYDGNKLKLVDVFPSTITE